MYQAYNWMNIDIMDLKLTWSYLWSVILKYSSWALIDKVLQFVFEFDRSIDEKKFDFLIFLIFWSCNTVIEIGLISVLNYISEVDTDKPTKSKLEFEVIPKSFWPIVFPLKSKICLSIRNWESNFGTWQL